MSKLDEAMKRLEAWAELDPAPLTYRETIAPDIRTVLSALKEARAEVATCDGHGYLRDEVARLTAELREERKGSQKAWMEVAHWTRRAQEQDREVNRLTAEVEDHKTFLRVLGVKLLNAGFKGDAIADGVDWLTAEVEMLREQLAARGRDAEQYAANWNKYQERAEQAEARYETLVHTENARAAQAEAALECERRDPAHENCRNAEAQLERQRDVAEAALAKAQKLNALMGICLVDAERNVDELQAALAAERACHDCREYRSMVERKLAAEKERNAALRPVAPPEAENPADDPSIPLWKIGAPEPEAKPLPSDFDQAVLDSIKARDAGAKPLPLGHPFAGKINGSFCYHSTSERVYCGQPESAHRP